MSDNQQENSAMNENQSDQNHDSIENEVQNPIEKEAQHLIEKEVQNPTEKESQNPIEKEAQHLIEKEVQNPTEKESQNPIEKENADDDDKFIRVTAAHQMLVEAQTNEEQENYPLSLHLYRICVDLLLEELMFEEGTDQSRLYLREKCTALMDRIDLLKTKLEPIPTEQSTITNPPIEQLESVKI